MSKPGKHSVDRLLEILADEAVFGLGADQDDLLKAVPEDLSPQRRDEMMRVAGLTQLSFLKLDTDACQDMPEHVREKILNKADGFFARKNANEHASKVVEIDAFRPVNESQEQVPRNNMGVWIGWSVAAALMIALIIQDSGFVPILQLQVASIEQQRTNFLNDNRDVIIWPWTVTNDFDPAGIDGDVVWSNSTQQGYLRLAGLPANDPGISQYQLWIVDPSRDSNPVDGGVFDVLSAASETIVRIEAKLEVNSPVAFAVTREQPGGVVVSAGPLLIVATTKS